jgi:hypothetical protein
VDLTSEGTVNINFKPVVDHILLNFTDTYKNNHQESYKVKTFKFYISNIEFINSATQVKKVIPEYFLFDASEVATTVIPLKLASGIYNRMAFTIGVDSTRNVSGAQTGALDPGKGMFWTWNSGYIMAKLEGTSSSSNQVDNKFEYHIGGFKGNENVVKRIEMDFPSSETLQVVKNKASEISIEANVNSWFSTPFELQISEHPVCTTPGALSIAIAENYYNMFTVIDIINH